MPRRIDGSETLEPEKDSDYWRTPEGCAEALKKPPSNREILDIFSNLRAPLKDQVDTLRKDIHCAYDAVSDDDLDGEGVATFLEKRVRLFQEKTHCDIPSIFSDQLNSVCDKLRKGQWSRENIGQEMEALLKFF